MDTIARFEGGPLDGRTFPVREETKDVRVADYETATEVSYAVAQDGVWRVAHVEGGGHYHYDRSVQTVPHPNRASGVTVGHTDAPANWHAHPHAPDHPWTDWHDEA